MEAFFLNGDATWRADNESRSCFCAVTCAAPDKANDSTRCYECLRDSSITVIASARAIHRDLDAGADSTRDLSYLSPRSERNSIAISFEIEVKIERYFVLSAARIFIRYEFNK